MCRDKYFLAVMGPEEGIDAKVQVAFNFLLLIFFYRLGQGSENSALTPNKIIFDYESCKLAAIGTDHSLFLTDDGKVWSCGMNQYHQVTCRKTISVIE